jgi:hypothetical protein
VGALDAQLLEDEYARGDYIRAYAQGTSCCCWTTACVASGNLQRGKHPISKELLTSNLFKYGCNFFTREIINDHFTSVMSERKGILLYASRYDA